MQIFSHFLIFLDTAIYSSQSLDAMQFRILSFKLREITTKKAKTWRNIFYWSWLWKMGGPRFCHCSIAISITNWNHSIESPLEVIIKNFVMWTTWKYSITATNYRNRQTISTRTQTTDTVQKCTTKSALNLHQNVYGISMRTQCTHFDESRMFGYSRRRAELKDSLFRIT